jgi:hypothetical protein
VKRVFDGGEDKEMAQVFAPPVWLRGLNVVAAGAVAAIVVLWAFGSTTSVAIQVASAAFAAAFVAFGVRAMTSQVTVSSTSVRYRGFLRNREVPLTQVVGLGISESWLSIIFGDIPALISRSEDGSVRKVDLLGLASTTGKFGSDAVASTTQDLHATLEPYIRRNL